MHGGPWSPPCSAWAMGTDPGATERLATCSQQPSGCRCCTLLCSSCSYLHILLTENQVRSGEREGRIWSRNFPLCSYVQPLEGSLVLALCLPISWPWPGVLFTVIHYHFKSVGELLFTLLSSIWKMLLFSFEMKSSVYREVSGLMDLVCLNTDSSTYQESKHEYTMCTPIAWE